MWCNGDSCIFPTNSTAFNCPFRWLHPIIIILNSTNHNIRFFWLLNNVTCILIFYMQPIPTYWRIVTTAYTNKKDGNEVIQILTIADSVFIFVLFTFGKVTVWIVSWSGMRSVKIFSFPMYCSSLQSPISAECLGLVTSRHSLAASVNEKHQIVQHYSHRNCVCNRFLKIFNSI